MTLSSQRAVLTILRPIDTHRTCKSAITHAFLFAYLAHVLTHRAHIIIMFLGRTGGSAGETCALALIIGGVYLAIRKVIDVKIPFIFILTYFLVTLAIYKDANVAGCGILSGGLLLGAIFMATDYSTSPDTVIGTCIYAFGCGLLTAIFRKYGSMPEGVSFAILLMNVVTPLLDKYIRPRPFGYVKPVKPKKGKKSEKEAQA